MKHFQVMIEAKGEEGMTERRIKSLQKQHVKRGQNRNERSHSRIHNERKHKWIYNKTHERTKHKKKAKEVMIELITWELKVDIYVCVYTHTHTQNKVCSWAKLRSQKMENFSKGKDIRSYMLKFHTITLARLNKNHFHTCNIDQLK